jgi:hypothetical protein
MKNEKSGVLTVLNPRGQPYMTHFSPMAARPASLDGKTVYFVDLRFLGGYSLLQEMIGWFNRNMPQVKTVFREKVGDYFKDDPELWAEIKEKGDAMIAGVGH